MNLSSLLPISAVVAVCIFVVKEILEHLRRRKAEQRKIGAIKLLIARECELNAWTIAMLVRIYKDLLSEETDKYGFTFHAESKRDGSFAFIKLYPDGDDSASMPIPSVHRDSLAKHLLDIATSDANFLQVAEDAYDALADVNHVRNYLLEMQPSTQCDDDTDSRYGLAQYALGELEPAKRALDLLYEYCAGKKLTTHRLR